jgi:thioredoxin-dependent peroxiredoxin
MSSVRKGAVKWRDIPTDLQGPEIKVGDKAPTDWSAVAIDMSAVTGATVAGKKRILLTAPSLDTATCDTEARTFNQRATEIPGIEIYVASMDLPFAQKRWCSASGVDRVTTLSDYKDRTLGAAWGVFAPSKGLLARAVFVIGADDTVTYVEYVADATTEPNYDAALAAAKTL